MPTVAPYVAPGIAEALYVVVAAGLVVKEGLPVRSVGMPPRIPSSACVTDDPLVKLPGIEDVAAVVYVVGFVETP